MRRTTVQRVEPQASVTDVLDRVLDRGIVIDAWLRVSVAGIALIDVDATIVVASIDTYVRRADDLATAARAARSPAARGRRLRPGERAARRRARPGAMQCAAGCTFTGRWSGSPATVRCPVDRRRVCAVAPLPDAA
jgi:gas vesicle structural protein